MLATPVQAAHPSRAAARSTRGMVASPHALATAAGTEVLRRGGNAVDAAIAVNAVLSVVYPASNGVGGDAFWMIYEPRSDGVVCYNGSGRAARGLDAALLRERGMRDMPLRGAFTVTVPGAVRSWEDVCAAHGSRRLDELLAPAQAYAREGYAVTDVVAHYLELNEATLRQDPDAAALFLSNGLPRAGTILKNPGLAATLGQIRRGGAGAFYEGPSGKAIVAKLRAGGNPIELEDLAGHHTQQTLPWRLAWRGGEILSHPPNSHGSAAQVALGAIDGMPAGDEAAWTHLAIEAFKHAFRLRDTRYGDPDFVPLTEREFLSRDMLSRIRAKIDPDRVTASFRGPDRGDTVAIVVVDADGRAVTLIESLFMNFGSGLVAGESGIVLQNRGAYFNLLENHPNELRGGHRPVHTLSPAMYLREGKPELVYGSMGGDSQPQIHAQILHNVYEREMGLQQAIDAPRWVAGRPHIPGHDDIMTETVLVESRIPDEIVDGLERRGHTVERLGPYEHTMGHGHAIRIDRKEGTLAGAADPRADSLALGV